MSSTSPGVKLAYNPAAGTAHGMNHFIEGILKITLLEASAATLVVDRLLGHGKEARFGKGRQLAFLAAALLAVFAWTHFGNFRNGGVVHVWEQFHFYLGAKYQKEVGWFDLYKATILADRESTRILGGLVHTRDLHTFELQPVAEAMQDAARVRAAFSDERWELFKADWTRLAAMPVNWAPILSDHGNSESPAWAIFAHPIAALVPITPGGQAFIAMLDVVLMLVVWGFLFRTFGIRATSVGLLIWASLPIVFDYNFGSFLRWDWLFALGMAMGFLKREKYATAGAFFGFAVATKLFPLFFGVALLFRALMEVWRERKIPVRYLRFGAGAFGCLLVSFLLSSAICGGPGAWLEYKKRIDVAMVEKYYPIQYSLKTVYLQVAASAPKEFRANWATPREIKQARHDVNVADYRWGFLAAQLFFTLLVVAAAARADDVSAFSLGPFLVFTWLTVNMYYWHMLGLAALGLSLRKERPPFFALLGLHFILGVYYLHQHFNRGFSEAYLVALLIAGGLIAFGGAEALALAWALYKKLAPAAQKKAASA